MSCSCEGGVAVQPGGEWASSLRLAGCVFRNNSGVETPGDYVYDYGAYGMGQGAREACRQGSKSIHHSTSFHEIGCRHLCFLVTCLAVCADYSSGVVQRPVVPASALALGRGTHHISGCVFEDNAPLPLLSGSQQAWYNASTVRSSISSTHVSRWDMGRCGLLDGVWLGGVVGVVSGSTPLTRPRCCGPRIQASATVDFSCWQGPASLHIEDSVFTVCVHLQMANVVE